MTEFEIGDDEYTEVNTSYDQDKEIGSTPSAYFAHSQPMNAKNGDNFMSIQKLDEDTTVESLNKNGTGVRKATRGVNPKKTKASVLEFVYVSKSECDICKQYDGQMFAIDSPNRPVIPRLESQGDGGSRPYTHPNCKCKWVRPFSNAGIANFGQSRGGEAEANELKQKTIDSVRKEYGELKYDALNREKQMDLVLITLLKRLKSPESFDPTSLPIASMLKMTYDAIQPTLALQLAKMKHHNSNEVRDIIDDMVGESLTSERKHKIVLEHNLDFSFENLLELTAVALFESDEHDIWDEDKNKLIDPSLLEEATEGGRGSGRKGHQKWMLGGEADPEECPNCMIYTEKKDNNCQICGNSY